MSITRTDPTAGRASDAIGGPLGRYAAAGPRALSALVILLAMTGFTLAMAYVEKSPCADANWQHSSQYTHICYSDVIPLWGAEGLDTGQVPYRDHAVEYPVLTGGFMYGTALLTRAVGAVSDTFSPVQLFGGLTAIGLSICGLLVTYFSARTSRGRPWDAAIFALSPLLVFHAFSNWDLLAMVFTAAALWAWSRERVVLAGVMIGLGTAAKLYPVFLLVALGVLAVRSGKIRPVVWTGVAAVVTWLAVNLPIAAAYFTGWKEFYVFSAQRDAEASTFWAMGHYVDTGGLRLGSLERGTPGGYVPDGLAVAVVLLLALGLVCWLALAAPRRPRVAQVVLLVVIAFLLTTKVWSPQYSIWLVPLVALARPRWRIALLWQFSEILVWVLTLLWLAGFNDPNRALDYGWLMLAVLIRDGFVLCIAALVVREMWRPELDVVRADGADDPGGGVFDGAEDDFALSGSARELRRLRLADVTAAEGEPDQYDDKPPVDRVG